MSARGSSWIWQIRRSRSSSANRGRSLPKGTRLMRIDMKRRWLPENVTPFTDKCGRVRYRFRKKGLPNYLFRAEPGTPEFMTEYQAAKQAILPEKVRYERGSFHALIESYYKSKQWARMGDAYQKVRGNALERFRAKHGDKPVSALQARHIDKWMMEISDTPHAANDLRKMLNQLMKHAILLGLRETNPVNATEAIRVDSEGYHCWSEDEIARFDTRWALGTRERLAKELLLYTALRRSDIVRIGRQNRQDNLLILRHSKNKSDTVIPILPPLARALDAIEVQHLTYLVTAFGKPFTAAGFGNWFGERCEMAGLPHCTAHGLRKAMARRLAEAGVSTLEGRAVTGHKSDAMFAHYAKKANDKIMAHRALTIVSDALGLANENGKLSEKGK
ncbi:hypothetical protein EQG66_11550 [Sphingobium fluviale]|uniref:Tyr recombinase domain-containing protein n=2 Tax=Sphingobium fluviale TaxID=2506423 RepID=A0A4Q1KHZ1_9SPHN|nr:hypothetical protein EQG66_11550 [Sphingobium fluviale]